MNPSEQRPLFLLRSFASALAHQVRTHLSIISNDLFFLQTLVQPGETARAIERCGQISELLKPAIDLAQAAGKAVPLSLGTEVKAAFPDAEIAEATSQVLAVPEQLRQLLQILAQRFPRESCEVCENHFLLRWSELLPSEVTSLTELATTLRLAESILPMLGDALLWAQGASLKAIGRELRITFQRVSDA